VRNAIASILVVLSLGHSGAAFGWGVEGHEVVALIAGPLLAPDARQRVDALLALEPGSTLASISTWADQSRDRSTAGWHYVNMPRDSACIYLPARDCPNGNCVVGALTTQVRRLSTTTGAEQLEALKYVVHFVADIHQPLHAGFADDKGGNTYQLQAFGRGTNLHAAWDTLLVRKLDPDSGSLAAALSARAAPSSDLSFAPALWAGESCQIASRPDFYPPRKLPDDYLVTFGPIVMDRLQLAGLRLAAILNLTLGSAGTK
jgi:nuclease S1